MATIIDYVAQETRDFSEYPFHVADALVYAILSYDKIPQEVPQLSSLLECFGSISSKLRNFNLKHPSRSLAALWRTPFPGPTLREVEERLHEYELTHPYWEHHSGFSDDDETPHRFYRSIKRNPRFAVTRMSAAEERFDISQQTQYAAETFQLPDGTLLVAFRGTDDSLIGWKEDFNMAFQYPVPAQRSASAYLDMVARLWEGPIILVGHSKGGNLAIYAAMNADPKVRKRIQHVYSLDGPGFPPEIVTSPAYRTIQPKVTKIVPSSSIVGMIFETPEPCRVVSSDSDGIMQHSAFTWLLDGDQFITEPDLSSSSQLFNEELNHWIATLTPEQRERAVDALFTVLHANGATSFSEVMSNFPASIPAMLGAYVGLTPADRRHLVEALAILFKASTAKRKPTPAPASAPSSATSKATAEIPAETAAGADSAAPARADTDADAGTTASPSAEDATEIAD